ncbi:hypothetical protein K493DRAFT_333040 [Basidiobolus meristosporus CBS 931.73]|uniref:Hydrophobin n=1 Tax=Basidiobolus meristosporus CBS 931.73 TaxID=1314790 RepID=A0A1Y1Z8Y2_9FUNG|nr:hypothetical protein K493DRAFT_333040 [Basidiobolus meristosporus CBS 931.73]|eukprot:ORY06729.1 hypothetical protein K493DRAFT_333040 [Basidiobolus meristosporus CBS 931.73]
MRFFTAIVCLTALLSVAFAAPLPLDLAPVVGELVKPVAPIVGPILSSTCNNVLVTAQVAHLANVDVVVCLDASKPVPAEIEQAASQVSNNCNILKQSITAKVDALGLLKVRAIVCLPRVTLYVSL